MKYTAANVKLIYNVKGFTLLELIIVIFIIGVISINAVPKFGNLMSYTVQSRAEAFASDIRHIKTLAVSGGRCVSVMLTSSGGVTSVIGQKPTDNNYPPCNGITTIYTSVLDPETSISGPATPLFFNNLGQPSAVATYTVTVGGSSKYVGVNAYTGLIVVCSSLPCPP